MTYDHDPRLVDIPADHISFVSRLVSEFGLVDAARRLKLSRTGVLGVLAIGRTMPGTAALVREAVAERRNNA